MLHTFKTVIFFYDYLQRFFAYYNENYCCKKKTCSLLNIAALFSVIAMIFSVRVKKMILQRCIVHYYNSWSRQTPYFTFIFPPKFFFPHVCSLRPICNSSASLPFRSHQALS
ncbi:hypothetical protein I3760_07G126800 [Carya illinoinensis]|nr:hypothetical protein I3760_07G126800 [Carya illinoinensis]